MATRSLIVRILGDASSLERAFLASIRGGEKVGSAYKAIGVDAQRAASIQVQAAVRADRALRENLVSLRAVARGAPAGSREQIAATNLANAAQLRLARSYGVTTREGEHLSRGARTLERDFSRTTRGFLAGTGIISGLGRSLAFASGGFLAFATVGGALRSSVDSARDAVVTQRQLAQQLKVSGESFQTLRPQIDASTQSLSALSGFNADELERSLTTIERGTGNVSRALQLNALAADIARGRHISLAQAAVAVGKAAAGSTTALRRLGIELPKGATGAEAIAIATRRFAGQAEAGATAADRFRAVLHNSEVIIGEGLLPTLNRYLERGTVWLQQMNESGRLQADVAAASRNVARAIHDVEAVVRVASGAIRGVDRVTGSFEGTLKVLGGTLLALRARALIARSGLFGLATAERAVGTSAVVGRVGAYTGAIGGMGAAAVGAESKVAALRNSLLGLAGLVITIDIIERIHTKNIKNIVDQVTHPLRGSGGGQSGDQFVQGQSGSLIGRGNTILFRNGQFLEAKVGGGDIAVSLAKAAKDLGLTIKQLQQRLGLTGGRPTFAIRRDQPGTATATPFPVPPATVRRRRDQSLQGQFNIDELRLAQARAAGNVANQRKILVAEAVILKLQAQRAKTLADATKITQQLAGVEDEIRGIDSQQATAKRTAKGKLASAAAKDALLAKARLDLAQGDTAAATALLQRDRARIRAELAQAKSADLRLSLTKQLTTVQNALKGALKVKVPTFEVPINLQLDEAKLQALGKPIQGVLGQIKAAAEKALKSGKLGFQGQLDAWNTIAQINDQLKTAATNALGSFKQANTKALVAGIGLTADQTKALRARLSQLGPGGTVPTRGVGAFGVVVGGGGDVVVHTSVNLDGRQVGTSVTRHQQKTKRRNPSQRRGPFAGGGL